MKNKNHGESPYWQWLGSKGMSEPGEANPDSVEEVKGLYYVDNELIEERKEIAGRIIAQFSKLSNKERYIINLLMNGYSQYDISTKLKISRNSVKEYVTRIRRKLKRYAKI